MTARQPKVRKCPLCGAPAVFDTGVWRHVASAPASEPEAPTGCPYWDTKVNSDPGDPDNHCRVRLSDVRKQATRAATLDLLDAMMLDLEFLPASEDSKGIVWVTMRDVQCQIDARKEFLREQGGGK